MVSRIRWKNTMQKLKVSKLMEPDSVCSRVFKELTEGVPESLVLVKDKGGTKELITIGFGVFFRNIKG